MTKQDASKHSKKLAIAGCVTLLLALALAYIFADRLSCTGDHANIRCLANHPFTFQLIDEAGDPVLDSAMARVVHEPCYDLQFTADTMTVTMAVVPNNVHYSEEISELVDTVLAKQPECFLEASERLDQKARLKLNYVLDAVGNVPVFKSGGRESLRKFGAVDRFAESLNDLQVSK